MTDRAEQPAAQPESSQLPVQVFQEMDRCDEGQILAEMRGELIADFVYSAEIQGRQVTNLSYAGVKEAIRRRGNVEILDVRTEENETEIRALVKVRDHENRIDVLGASSAEKAKPFAYTLAVNKAERNAFAKLIPAKWFAALIEEYLNRNRAVEPKPEALTPAGTAIQGQEARPRVAVTKDVLSQPGLTQFPLVDGVKAIGMLNLLEDEVSLVPEKPIAADDLAGRNFLIGRVLGALCAKHPEMSYTVAKAPDGSLNYILLRGKLEDSQVKELQHAANWAFTKATERASAQP